MNNKQLAKQLLESVDEVPPHQFFTKSELEAKGKQSFETFSQIRARIDKAGLHSHYKLTCVKCGDVEQCRCSDSRRVVATGICGRCSGEIPKDE